jgi:LmbE family N-acetylglucosaminyl deacetylase
VLKLPFRRDAHAALKILCLGAHSDDIEIGCGGTILQLTSAYPAASVCWIVCSASDTRKDEAHTGANLFLERASEKRVVVKQFRESFFPYAGEPLKEFFEEIKSGLDPDLVFTHYRHDLHQDHKVVSDLTWNTFRRALILEYEIPKWDGDLGVPNCYVQLSEALVERKIDAICATFKSQQTRPWFTADTFRALMRLRGVESNVPFAEAFYGRKLALA